MCGRGAREEGIKNKDEEQMEVDLEQHVNEDIL